MILQFWCGRGWCFLHLVICLWFYMIIFIAGRLARNHQHPPSMTWRTGGSWHTSNHARVMKFGTQLKNHIKWWSMMSSMAQPSKTPVRNLQHPPSMTLRMGGSWHLSNHSRELKFGKQVKNHIKWWSMMSRMTQTSKNPVRNHQCLSNMTLSTGGSWHTSNHARDLKFGKQVKNHLKWWFLMARVTPFSKNRVRNHYCPPSMTFRYLPKVNQEYMSLMVPDQVLGG